MRPLSFAPVAASLLLGLAACTGGGDDDKDTDSGAPVETDPPEPLPPTITIDAPGAGDVVLEGYAATVELTIDDPDGDVTQVEVDVSVGGTQRCLDIAPDASGRVVCETVFDLDDTTIDVLAIDADGDRAEASATLEVTPTEAPAVGLTLIDVPRRYADVPVAFTGTATDAEDAPAALVLELASDLDGTLTPPTLDDQGRFTADVPLSQGTHSVTLVARDTTGKTGRVSQSVTVGGPNQAPDCDVARPLDGQVFASGEDVAGSGTATDRDQPNETLTVTWTSDLDGLVSQSPPTRGGTLAFTTSTLSVGDHVLTLEVVDETGATCTDSTRLTVALPPSVALTAPPAGTVGDVGTPLAFEATVADDVDAPPDLTVQWRSNRDGLLGSSTADGAGLTAFSTLLSQGPHTITVEVTDTDGFSASAAVDVRLNGRPTAPGVVVTPASPGATDDLTAVRTVDATDPDGDALTYEWSWTVDGVPAGITDPTVPAAATATGERWEVTVVAFDGRLRGPGASARATVLNGRPSLDTVALDPSQGDETTVFTCRATGAQDPEGDPITLAHAWTVDGTPVAATTDTLDGADFDRGQSVVCTVTPSDPSGAGAPVSSDPVVIDNSPPTVDGASLAPEGARRDDTLTCTAGTLADADPADTPSATYAWAVDGAPVPGETGSTLAGAFVRDEAVTCTVTPTDGLDDGPPAASAPVVIANTPPVVTGAVITPSDPSADDVLTCTADPPTDADGDPVTLAYAWTIDGAPAGMDAPTLAGPFTTGASIVCTVTPRDDREDGEPVASPAVQVANAPPVVTGIAIQPGALRVTDVPTCVVTTDDPDGDAVTVDIAWFVDGTDTGVTGATFTGTLVRDDSLTCRAIPDDGTDTGAAATSLPVRVDNSPPVVSGVRVDPPTPQPDDVVTCLADPPTDADGDPVTLAYAWTIDGLPAGTGTDRLMGPFPRGASLVCTVTPSDGLEDGEPVASPPTLVGNTPPEINRVEVRPDPVTAGSGATCHATASDADGDAFTLSYAWVVDGLDSGRTGETYPDVPVRGQTLACTAVADDGTDPSDPATSDPVDVVNSLPTVASATVLPPAPTPTDVLTCVPGATADADGDGVALSYAWAVAGVLVGETSDTLTAGFDRGDAVTCTITPDDGLASGPAVTSPPVVVGNTPPVVEDVALTPTEADATTVLTCTPGTVRDDDGDPTTVAFRWTVDDLPVPGETSDTLAGAFVRDDRVVCHVTASDGSALSAEVASNPVVVGNAPPVVLAATVTPEAPVATDTLSCDVTTDDPDGDAVTVSIRWVVGGVDDGTLTGPTLSGAFAKGDDVVCLATPDDGLDTGTEVSSAAVFVGNLPPTATAVVVAPEAPTRADTATCTATGDDPDGDAVTLAFAWTVDGADAGAGPSLDLAPHPRGAAVVCTATPDDGDDLGLPVASTPVAIVNAPPSIDSARLVPEDPVPGDPVVCTASGVEDLDGDRVTLTYAWTVDDAPDPTSGDTIVAGDRGQRIACTVTPDDGADAGPPVSAGQITVGNQAPTVTSIAVDPPDARSDDALTCLVETDDGDGDPVTVTVRWLVDGSPAGTGPTLGSGFARDQAVACEATPDDGLSTGVPVRSDAIVIANGLPTVGSATITPDPAVADDTLACTPGPTDDPDGDAVDLAIAWSVEGVEVGTGPTLAGAFARGEEVVCTVVPSDGIDDGPSVASTPVTIANAPPVLDGVAITPDAPRSGDDLTCAPGAVRDADGDPVTLTYTWQVGDGIVPVTADVLDASFHQPGDDVTCTVVPDDGLDDGAARSATVTVLNSAPVIRTVTLAPDPPTARDDLTATVDAFDPDGDPVTLSYAWTVDGTPVAGEAGDTLPASAFGRDQVVAVAVTPDDGVEVGAAVSDSVIVQNTAPSGAVPQLTADGPRAGVDDLRCAVATPAVDPDEEPVSYLVAWEVDGAPYTGTARTTDPGVVGDTIDAAETQAGETWTCSLTATDGDLVGPTDTTDVTIADPARAEGTDLTVASGEVLTLDGEDRVYDHVRVEAGGTLQIRGTVRLEALSFTVEDGGVVDGFAGGEPGFVVEGAGRGAGAGDGRAGQGSGGAGHGAAGGAGAYDPPETPAAGGAAYGTLSGPDLATGSSGGTSWGGVPAGSGGAALEVVAELIEVRGLIDVSGQAAAASPFDGSGGGAGGAVTLVGDTIDLDRGEIRLSGGDGGDAGTLGNPGGGASGGRLKLFYDASYQAGAYPRTGGASGGAGFSALPARDGGFGSFHVAQRTYVGPRGATAGPDLLADGATVTLTAGSYAYDSVRVINGGTLEILGTVALETPLFFVDDTSVVDGVGLGRTPPGSPGDGIGPGAGTWTSGRGGGGAGHGGDGGQGASDTTGSPSPGGVAYGSEIDDSVLAGSTGGRATTSTVVGAGGAGLAVTAANLVVDGLIDVSGTSAGLGSTDGNGGGSGGTIVLVAETVSVGGELRARGGNGGSILGAGTSEAGGGGAGGRIKVFYETLGPIVTTDVDGGRAGIGGTSLEAATDGAPGTVHLAARTYTGPGVGTGTTDLIVDGATTLPSGTYRYDTVTIRDGGTLTVSGEVRLEADAFVLEPAGAIDGFGRGHAGGAVQGAFGEGPGGGEANARAGAGGGGHGGAGGTGGYDTTDTPNPGGGAVGVDTGVGVDAGSGGGCSQDGFDGGAGGAALVVVARDIAAHGTIDLSGEDGLGGGAASRGGGGGAGGGLVLAADTLDVTGLLVLAQGGTGGLALPTTGDGGGGGAGGRVKLAYDTGTTGTATVDVLGGLGQPAGDVAPGQDGADGTFVLQSLPWVAP